MLNQEFVKMVVTKLKEIMGDGYHIEHSIVTKNNGIHLCGIKIFERGKMGCAVIYIDEYKGLSVADAAKAIAEKYKTVEQCPDKYESIIKNIDKKFILEHCEARLINTEKNAEQLKVVPCDEMLDLSITYRILINEAVEDEETTEAAILITNKIMEKFGISHDELKTASNVRKYKCMTMCDVIGDADESGMYVLTNENNKNGAAVLMHTEYFKALADKLESDLYILPSSIHEVIAIKDNCDGKLLLELKEMVYEINRTCIDPEEFLSDSIYRYNRETDMIEIANR